MLTMWLCKIGYEKFYGKIFQLGNFLKILVRGKYDLLWKIFMRHVSFSPASQLNFVCVVVTDVLRNFCSCCRFGRYINCYTRILEYFTILISFLISWQGEFFEIFCKWQLWVLFSEGLEQILKVAFQDLFLNDQQWYVHLHTFTCGSMHAMLYTYLYAFWSFVTHTCLDEFIMPFCWLLTLFPFCISVFMLLDQ